MAEVLLYKRGSGNAIVVTAAPTQDSARFFSLGVGIASVANEGSIAIGDASGGNAAYLHMQDGQSAAVSSASTGRFRYNETDQVFEKSENGGAYHRFVPDATQATATADTTTTSTTDVLVNAMTLTPSAGTYLVWFTGSVDHDTNNATIETSIYVGGTQQTASERSFMRGASQGAVTSSFSCVAVVTVNGSQAIEGRWRTSGATATMHERTLAIVEVR